MPLTDEALVNMLKALAHPHRFRIVEDVAAAGELSVGTLAADSPLSQPTISHHLKQLAEAGLLELRNDAQRRYVSARLASIEGLVEALTARLARPASKKPARR